MEGVNSAASHQRIQSERSAPSTKAISSSRSVNVRRDGSCCPSSGSSSGDAPVSPPCSCEGRSCCVSGRPGGRSSFTAGLPTGTTDAAVAGCWWIARRSTSTALGTGCCCPLAASCSWRVCHWLAPRRLVPGKSMCHPTTSVGCRLRNNCQQLLTLPSFPRNMCTCRRPRTSASFYSSAHIAEESRPVAPAHRPPSDRRMGGFRFRETTPPVTTPT